MQSTKSIEAKTTCPCRKHNLRPIKVASIANQAHKALLLSMHAIPSLYRKPMGTDLSYLLAK